MKNVMGMITIPGLDASHRLEDLREASMRSSLQNLRRQTKARIVASIMSELADKANTGAVGRDAVNACLAKQRVQFDRKDD